MKNLYSFFARLVKIGMSFCSFCLLSAAAWGQTEWLRHFSPTDTLHSVQLLPDGYAFFAHNDSEIYRLRVDSVGNTLDSLPLGPVPTDLVPAAGGGFFKCFLQDTAVWLEKRDESGTVLWEQVFADSFSQKDLKIAALPNGGCYLVSAAWPMLPPSNLPFQRTLTRRITADGNLEWQLIADPMSWLYSGKRNIKDALTMPDGSCLVLSRDEYYSSKTGSRLLLILPDGTLGPGVDFTPTGAYFAGNVLHTARPDPDGTVLATGISHSVDIYLDAHIGYAYRVKMTAPPSLESYMYPVIEVIHHGPTNTVQPWVSAPMPAGDMLVIEKEKELARLWRGSWNLEDTLWVRPLTPEGGFFPEKIKNLNRLIYPTPDHGAIVGGVDSAGIFLQKIGLWSNDTTLTTAFPNGANRLEVRPNPAGEQTTVFFPSPDFEQLIVADLAGRKVQVAASLAGQTNYRLNCRHLPPGMYGLVALRRDGVLFRGKLLVR